MNCKAIFSILISLVLMLGFTSIALAWDDCTSIDERQLRQARRIQSGLERGELTRWEYERLRREQYRIERAEGRAWADGWLSKAERRRLHKMLDRASRHIYRARHNEACLRPPRVVCIPSPRPRVRPCPPRWGWWYGSHYRLSGFISEPGWAVGWSFTIP